MTRSSGAVSVLAIAPLSAPALNSTAARGTRASRATGLWVASWEGDSRLTVDAAPSSNRPALAFAFVGVAAVPIAGMPPSSSVRLVDAKTWQDACLRGAGEPAIWQSLSLPGQTRECLQTVWAVCEWMRA